MGSELSGNVDFAQGTGDIIDESLPGRWAQRLQFLFADWAFAPLSFSTLDLHLADD